MAGQHERARALIVQSDGSLLVDVHAAGYESTREQLAAFAQIVKTPEHLHTYRITPVSLWNAAAAGWSPEEVKEVLREHARYGVPEGVLAGVDEQMRRFGRLVLQVDEDEPGALLLSAGDDEAAAVLTSYDSLTAILDPTSDERVFSLDSEDRGRVKQILAKLGFPVIDCAGYADGAPLPVELRQVTSAGEP
ncbi:MAG: helicase-associated domain-containing protein, partial [Myxococcota bacterium]